MPHCWVIYNGSLLSDKFADQARLVGEAARAAGIHPLILQNHEVMMRAQQPPADRPAFVIFLDKDINLALYLQAAGIPVFNDPQSIRTCDSKATQAILLAAAGVPMPETIIAPKVYPGFAIGDPAFYARVLARLGLPLVIKEAHGSFGQRVYLVETEAAFEEKVRELEGKDFVFQRFIASSFGRDVRVNVVGGRIVAAMNRRSETDFRANITNGGTASAAALTEAQTAISLRAAAALGAPFAGVDLLFGERGEPLVCEVNGVAHIRNLYNVTGVNAGDAMIAYALQQTGLSR